MILLNAKFTVKVRQITVDALWIEIEIQDIW